MIWLYRLLFWPLFVLMLPKYLLRLWRRGQPWRVGERFGAINPPAKKTGIKRVWVQAVSVGELRAIKVLIDELIKLPGVEVVLSTTTTTGFKVAQDMYGKKVAYLFMFPLDLFAGVSLKKIKPDHIILMESELWPELLHLCSQKRIPVSLINARLSDRTFKRLAGAPWAARWMMKRIGKILAGSKRDADRFLMLGANPELVAVTGNLKFDAAAPTPLEGEKLAALWASLGWSSDKTILLGSSTWPGEEVAMIKTFQAVRESHPSVRLLLCPRHAERGEEIENIIKTTGLTYRRRSRGESSVNDPAIVLADTTGELAKLTEIAAIVFVGKSLPPHDEGQTPIEAAGLGKAIIFGRGMSNFAAVSIGLADAGGAKWVGGPMELKETVAALLKHPQARVEMGRAAAEVFNKNRGATARTLEWLELTENTYVSPTL